MHQPYYKNILTRQIDLPWVRLHGTKDYLDMLKILGKYPSIHQTFNLVPSLLEQIEDYTNGAAKDKFLELSYKSANDLTSKDRAFISENFFSISPEKVISNFPRYYELYLKRKGGKVFNAQDYLDLQVWFNLAWIDPYFRQDSDKLRGIIIKERFFSEEEKLCVLEKQIEILKEIIPAYKKFTQTRQIETTISPYYHPILPLLYNTNIAREADVKTILPKLKFAYPQDAKAQIEDAVEFYKDRFGADAIGMWPSEESVSEHILPLIIGARINWIVTDEAILFKSKRIKKRDTQALYHPYLLRRKEGNLSIIFRDRNLSDLISFVYHSWKTQDAVNDFIKHLEGIHNAFQAKNILVTVAMDGENAWEYYVNDGHDFLELLYQRLSDSNFIETTTINEYLTNFPPAQELKYLAAGSWIYGNFGKWIGNPYKARAWEYLAKARGELAQIIKDNGQLAASEKLKLALKQMYICEGSDWFWWYGENHVDFDKLFRMHLSNFYTLIDKTAPDYLKKPIEP